MPWDALVEHSGGGGYYRRLDPSPLWAPPSEQSTTPFEFSDSDARVVQVEPGYSTAYWQLILTIPSACLVIGLPYLFFRKSASNRFLDCVMGVGLGSLAMFICSLLIWFTVAAYFAVIFGGLLIPLGGLGGAILASNQNPRVPRT